MQLIGLLDSPYVRRVAISLHHLGVPFEHSFLSVFRNMDEFKQVNPLIKAPTLVCDDGTVLMDSTLILEYVERLAGPGNTLMPEEIANYQKALRIIGLGINACDKSVQIEYERKRPLAKQYQPWLDRIQAQLINAYDFLEAYATETSDWLITQQFTQADITVAVAWQFTQLLVSDVVDISRYPALSAFSQRAEALAAFQTTPLEPGWAPKF